MKVHDIHLSHSVKSLEGPIRCVVGQKETRVTEKATPSFRDVPTSDSLNQLRVSHAATPV